GAKLTDKVLFQWLAASPRDCGYRTNAWTVALLRGHARRKLGLDLSDWAMRQRLRQAGFRWKRPRHAFSEKDPHPGQKKGLLSGVCAGGARPRRSWPRMKPPCACFRPCGNRGPCGEAKPVSL